MKTQRARAWSGMLGLAALLIWSGCSSTRYGKNDDVGRSLQVAARQVQTESNILDWTITSLNELITQPAPDLKPQFARFSTALDHLIVVSRGNNDAIRRITAKNRAYFAAWDKELATMNYEVIRTRSEARKAEVGERFEKVNTRYHEAQTVMDPLLEYLQDIRRALRTDLTPGGLEAVKSIVNNATENAGKVQTALARLATDLEESGVRMSSIAAENPSIPSPTGIQQ